MRNNNINMNNICDRETFLESCKYFKSSAICQSACYLQILLCPKEKMREINDSPEKSSHFYLIDRTEVFNEALRCEPFRKRMKEIVEELYEMCQV
ncbi:hypothetical protein JTB14_023759 [Gonioctena quinquepunctata]|nr:hypothetical protein JTB14_023759 [Gonioctena quinquepunctata]